MWKTKRFILIAALVAVVLVGSLAGIAFAQTGSTDNAISGKTLMARVAAILGIDQQKVEDAFAQAQREMQEEALDNHLKNLIDQGKITQEQADEHKAWLKASPDMEPFRQQLREWQQAKPSIPGLEGIPGFGGPGGRGSRGMMPFDPPPIRDFGVSPAMPGPM